MDFFYQDEKIDYHSDLYLKLIHSGIEYSSVLLEKIKPIYSNTELVKISGINHMGEQQTSYTVCLYENNEIKEFFFLNKLISNSHFGLQAIEKKLQITNIVLEKIENINIEKNKEKLFISKEIFKNFFNIKKEHQVKDKHGEIYQLKIVENADSTIGSGLIIDAVYLLKNNNIIGYLKAKYTTTDMLKHHNMDHDKSLHIWKKVATIDYAKINDGYTNKGLGYVMYFYMAQHLNAKKIQFRESTVQSEQAQRLWNGIQKNLDKNVKVKKINNEDFVCFLNVGKNSALLFENKKPVVLNKRNK